MLGLLSATCSGVYSFYCYDWLVANLKKRLHSVIKSNVNYSSASETDTMSTLSIQKIIPSEKVNI